MPYVVIHEDNHLIGVNKMGGILVQGDQTGDMPVSEMVKLYIKERYKKPGAVFLGVIHRLDRPVSGVVVLARTSKALQRMNKLFQDREVKKTYLAIVSERPNPISGTLVHYLLKDPEKNVTKAYDQVGRRTAKAKRSELDYDYKGTIGGHHLLEIHLKTGRSHQIRAQLAKIGVPIRGDLKYGSKSRNQDGTIHLHGHSISFIHPVKKEKVHIVADVPNEQLWNQFRPLIES